IGNDGGAARKLAHREALRRDLAAEARADFPLGLRMELQSNLQGFRSALPRVVVGRGADTAEAEHDVLRREAALERAGKPRRVIAQVMRPRKAQAALRQRADQEAEVLVLALSDQQLVADDECAEHQVPRRWASR